MTLGVLAISVSDSNNLKPVDFQADKAKSWHLDLDGAEREILLKACKLYRARIPSYLQSRQTEVQMVDNIIEKLR